MSHTITQPQEHVGECDKRMTTANGNLVIPLRSVDNCKSRGQEDVDKCFEAATTEWGMEWDKSTEWKDGVHLGVNQDKRKHQATVMRNMVKRLTSLPPKDKTKIIVGQIIRY